MVNSGKTDSSGNPGKAHPGATDREVAGSKGHLHSDLKIQGLRVLGWGTGCRDVRITSCLSGTRIVTGWEVQLKASGAWAGL